MNKLLVSAIAGAAGLTLLLGGAGTFALWNSSTSIAGGTITGGALTVVDNAAAGVWKSGATEIILSTYKIVPGDVLTYTKKVDITATGDNMVATLAVASASITATSATNTPDGKLAGYITKSAQVSISGVGISGAGPTYTITPTGTGVTSRAAVVTVILTFPKSSSAGAENDAMLGSVNLGALAVTLTQTT